MKKALLTEALRSIWKTRSRFFSILAIVAVGTGFFAGIKACTPDMMLTVEQYFKDYNLADIHLVSTYGFDDKDIAALKNIDGMEAMMTAYSAELFAEAEEGSDIIVKVYSLPLEADFTDKSWMNRPVLKEGRLPEKPGECLVEQSKKTPETFRLGETVQLRANKDEELSDTLNAGEYTIVGICESPYYLDSERGNSSIGDGVVDTFIMIPEENFCYEEDIYTDVYLLLKGTQGISPYEDSYEECVQTTMEKLERLAEERSTARYEEIIEEANTELADAKKELAEGIETQQKEIADAKEKIAEAEQDLRQGEEEYQDGLATFEKEIADAEKKLKDAEDELAEGEAKLKSSREELSEGWDEYMEGEEQYELGLQEFENQKAAAEAGFAEAEAQKATLEQQQAQLLAAIDYTQLVLQNPSISEEDKAAGMKKLAELQTQEAQVKAGIQQIEKELEEGRALLAAGEQEMQAAGRELSKAYNQLKKGERELEKGEQELKDAKQEIADGWKELSDKKAEGKQDLYEAQQKIEDGKGELEQAQLDLEEGEAESNAEIADAKEKLAEAEQELADLEAPEWYLWDREDFGGYASFRDDMMKVDAIAAVFPVFFLLVAGLVCLTTMSRMVEEERTQIGTMKALGYGETAIVSKYLIYAVSASLFGSALGLSIGFQLFPKVIIAVYRTMYVIPSPMTPFHWDYAIACTIAAVACTSLAAFVSCRKELQTVPAQLMRPKAPKSGKRVWLERLPFLWERLSFTYKVTLRNVFRYKRRAFMTIVGVAGCTALMVAGFGIRHAIGAIVTRQYGDIFCYDGMAILDDVSPAEKTVVLEEIQKHSLVQDTLLAYQETVEVRNESGKTMEVYMVIPEQSETFQDYIVLRDRRSQEKLPLMEDQLIVNEKLAKVMGWSTGDKVTVLIDGQEAKTTIAISAVTENYTLNYIYLLPAVYETAFGEAVDYNTVFFHMNTVGEESESRLSQELLENDSILGLSYASSGNEKFMDMVNSLDVIVWVLIASAGLLAVIVLYNLANININERVRELATIKVLGFYDREVSAYVYRENNISTALGILFGLVLGAVLEQFALVVVEADNLMFAPDLPATVFLYSALLTLLFAWFINILIHFKLKKINMVESMKSVE